MCEIREYRESGWVGSGLTKNKKIYIKKVEKDISGFSKVILAFDCMGPPSHFSFTFRRKKKKLCVCLVGT